MAVSKVLNASAWVGPANSSLSTSSYRYHFQEFRIADVAKLCADKDVPHMVNNAYGLQCESICKDLNKGFLVGRIDAFVQSTDKNFMVPVGGAIIAGFDEAVVKEIAEIYPGRGSSGPSVDLLITLLSMGVDGYLNLLLKRKECFDYLLALLSNWTESNEERIVPSTNPISIAVSLKKLDEISANGSNMITELGSMIFMRNCSGCRYVANVKSRCI
ncbi:unnamed protein product [Soboliphyme baturini]|uniref:O-phosphoseryl-tRNA(Sec) selenium transferase n=1 Tax=Soboliphyme baturini TaxID=241478 RepID=A0A183J7M7_9BILA|nr:unnamed protein product [Soboliphyme baturini]